MKRNKLLIAGILAIALTFALILAGCDNASGGGSTGGSGGETTPPPELTGAITISPNSGVTTGNQLTANYSGGTETVTYQWKMGGTDILNETGKTHTPGEAGSYTVTVSAAGYRSKTSDAVDVTGNPIPSLSGTITITNGTSPISTATTGTQLTAKYSGSESPTYQWKKGGIAIDGATGTTYTPTEEGSYTVTVSAAGKRDKTSVAVTVITPELTGNITISPSSGVTTYTKLTATYSGSEGGTTSYQWKKGGIAIDGATGASYTPTAAGSYTVTVSKTSYQSKTSAAVTVTAATPSQQFRNILNNLQADSAELQTELGMTAVVLVKDLTLTANLDVPSGVIFAVNEGKVLTVGAEATLNLGVGYGSLVLMHNATLTVNGKVYAKSNEGEGVIPGITIMPIGTPAVTINGSGIIHLTNPGHLIHIGVGQKLTLSGTITLDGLITDTKYPGTSVDYPPRIGGDLINNDIYLVHVGGELDMQGGTITGNYNTNSTHIDGGGVEVNKLDTGDGTGAALFTMSGNAKVTGNRAAQGGGGVNVCQGGTFIMNGGTIYGSSESDSSLANKATSWGASLGKRSGGTAQYGDGSAISLTENSSRGTNATLTGKK